MSRDRTLESDKELWRSLTAPPSAGAEVVSELDFAAWLEGRLSEADAARIDAARVVGPRSAAVVAGGAGIRVAPRSGSVPTALRASAGAERDQ